MWKPFSSKEKRLHYTAKANDERLDDEARAYAKGQRDARNDGLFGYLLGKKSPLSEAEKQEIKDKRRQYYDSKKPAKSGGAELPVEAPQAVAKTKKSKAKKAAKSAEVDNSTGFYGGF